MQAETAILRQKTILAEASITDSTLGNVRRMEIHFGGRRLISEQLIDNTATIPMLNDFGQIPSEASASTPTRKRLVESTWLVDGANNGFYLPSQPDFELVTAEKATAYRMQEVNTTASLTRQWLRLEFGPTNLTDMAEIADLMSNPVLAPLQITEDDDDEIIVYDLATKTTAYVITKSSERMNSAGYLSGSGQPCVVLIRAQDSQLSLSAGKNGESGPIRLKLFGDWKPAEGETALLKCEPKAGRTWVEFMAGTAGTSVIKLTKLPQKSYFQRLSDIFRKK